MTNRYPIPMDEEFSSSPYIRPRERSKRRRSRIPLLLGIVFLFLIVVLAAYRALPDDVKKPLDSWLFGAEPGTSSASTTDTTTETAGQPSQETTNDIYQWECELPSGAIAILPVDRSANKQGIFLENPTDAVPEAVMPEFVRAVSGGVSVLILNTHSFESYSEPESLYFTDSSYASDNDASRNMAAVCRLFADALNENGIGTVFVDCMAESGLGSYRNAARMAELALEEYPDVCLIIDIHRGVLTDETGAVLRPVTQRFGQVLAQVKLIVGARASFETNMAVALALFEAVSAEHRALMMPTAITDGSLLQELPVPVLTLEIGTCGNDVSEAGHSAQLVAGIIAQLMK